MAATEKINRVRVKGLADQRKTAAADCFESRGFSLKAKYFPKNRNQIDHSRKNCWPIWTWQRRQNRQWPGQWLMRGLDSHNLLSLTELHRVGWRGWSLGKWHSYYWQLKTSQMLNGTWRRQGEHTPNTPNILTHLFLSEKLGTVINKAITLMVINESKHSTRSLSKCRRWRGDREGMQGRGYNMEAAKLRLF